MDIQWFPGHMTKARRQIEAKLKLIDIAIELLDARIPLSSRNPLVDEILLHKPRLIVLNKSDLADAQATKAWINYFANQGHTCIAVDSNSGHNVNQIAIQSKIILRDWFERQISRGINPRAMRALIVGIPNVGKSTLINKLAGRKIALTGDRPGVTKGQQWIKVTGGELELLDTPGILWPKFEDQTVGYRLAVTGAIKEEVLHIDDIAFYAVKDMIKKYWSTLADRYQLKSPPDNVEDPEEIVKIMEQIGRVRGCVISGGQIDFDKTSSVILRDFRAGKLGNITLELPDENVIITTKDDLN
ncbi:ribosome biogenesis GTPase YlqF [Paenibacillus yanchengensis]|uniref:Ribosome biogenesis GTPase A n=1 Tax=Paenibacillus yanchengensis TaxID=2035833 RepID=A0ABW4YMH4_9BACL